MKSFSEELAKICGEDLASLTCGGSYSVYSARCVTVEGHKGLKSLGNELISFVFDGGTLEISGQNLELKCLSHGFAVVKGNVKSVVQSA